MSEVLLLAFSRSGSDVLMEMADVLPATAREESVTLGLAMGALCVGSAAVLFRILQQLERM